MISPNHSKMWLYLQGFLESDQNKHQTSNYMQSCSPHPYSHKKKLYYTGYISVEIICYARW